MISCIISFLQLSKQMCKCDLNFFNAMNIKVLTEFKTFLPHKILVIPDWNNKKKILIHNLHWSAHLKVEMVKCH